MGYKRCDNSMEYHRYPAQRYMHLLNGHDSHECLTRKYTTRKIHTLPHPGLEWRIFHILTGEDIDAFADIKFVS